VAAAAKIREGTLASKWGGADAALFAMSAIWLPQTSQKRQRLRHPWEGRTQTWKNRSAVPVQTRSISRALAPDGSTVKVDRL